MKHLFTLGIITMAVFNLSAQFDYQLFRPDVQYLYENYKVQPENFIWLQSETASPIVGMKTDARECQELYQSLSNNGCRLGPSFAGYEICQSPGFTIMFMGEDQYLRLETQQPIGGSWTVGLVNDSLVTGRVTTIDTMSFLGLLDTVKTISFYHQETGLLVGQPVLISKQYGLVAAARFNGTLNTFPGGSLKLLGMSSPAVGLQNYTDDEVFDIQPGDVFHTYETSIFSPPAYLLAEVTNVDRREDRVIVDYTGQRITLTTIFRDEEIIDTATLTDVSFSWTYNQLILEALRRQPGEAFPSSPNSDEVYYAAQMFPADMCGLAGKRRSVDMFRTTPDECFFNSEALDGAPSFFFYPGLGRDFGKMWSNTVGELTMQYVNTSTLECGEPIEYEDIISSFLTDTPGIEAFRMYPNPAGNEFNLSVNAPGIFQVSIFDQSGRNMLSVDEITGDQVITTARLPAGAYHLLLMQEGVPVGRKRLIIE
jgi:hypothetical protein